MNNRRRIFRNVAAVLCFFGLFLTAFEAVGEVYLFGPRSGRGDELPGGEAEVLYSGAVEVNGVDGTLEVRRSDENYDRLAARFRALAAPGELSESNGMLRFIRRTADGVKRLLVVRGAARAPAVIFELSLPEPLPEKPSWPHELPPLPPDGIPEEVIRFEDGGVYGSYSGAAGSPGELLRRYSAWARSEGWSSVGNEAAPSIGGSGDLFVRFSPRAVMWMNFSESSGIFFRRDSDIDR